MSSTSLGHKKYPEEYDPQAVKILETMTFPQGRFQIYGSMTIPSQLYAGDYDSICFVDFPSLEKAVIEFQTRVKTIAELKDVFIADMKIGMIQDWNIWGKSKIQLVDNTLKVVDYNSAFTLKKLKYIYNQKVITNDEYDKYYKIIYEWKDTPNPKEYAKILKELRPHILRWNLQEVLQGFKQLPGNRAIDLSDALSSRGVVKVDCIGIVNGQSRFTDFSMIYEIKIRNKVITYDVVNQNVVDELRLSVYENSLLGNYYKALKRIFSLARYFRNTDLVNRLTEFLNGFVGLIYQVKSDVGTLLYLEENYQNLPREKIQYELKMFRVRLTAFNETYQNKKINNIIKELLESRSQPKSIRHYMDLEDILADIVNRIGKVELLKIYPKVVVE